MVFVSPDFSVNAGRGLEPGYGFALPRVLARWLGKKVRSAHFSAAEAYGVCLLVFGIHCAFVARSLIFPFVRPGFARVLAFALLPFATWIALLLLYYLNSLVLRLLRQAGLFIAWPNYQFQHVVIATLTSLIALYFWRTESGWLQSLGGLWLVLLLLNLMADAIEKLSREG